METVNCQASYTSCIICLERFKNPKVLPCGHTLCLKCIQKMVENSFKQCPKCQEKFTLPESGSAMDFPTNFELLDAIEDREAKSTTNREDSSPLGLQSKDHCILHDNQYEFFCRSCTKQACTKCLLDDHKPGKHVIVTRNDFIKEESAELEGMMRKLRSLRLKEGELNEKLTKAINSCQGELKEIEDKIFGTLEDKIQKLREAAQKMVSEMTDKSNVQLEILNQLQAKWKVLSTNLQHTQSTCLSKKAKLTSHDLNQTKLDEIRQSISELSEEAASLSQSCESMPSTLNMDFLPESVQTTTSVGTLVYSASQTNSQLDWQKTQTIAAYLLLLFIFVLQIFVRLLVGKRDGSVVPMFVHFSSKYHELDSVFNTKSRRQEKPGFKSLVHLHRLGEAFYTDSDHFIITTILTANNTKQNC